MIKTVKKEEGVTMKAIRLAVARSSKIEGLSLSRAIKNKIIIKKLKSYGRAFSV